MVSLTWRLHRSHLVLHHPTYAQREVERTHARLAAGRVGAGLDVAHEHVVGQ
jgi:hypothetical protein